jgi:hypothetical protein
MQIAFNKSVIKVHKSKEDLYLINAFKLRLVCNCLNLFKVYTNAFLTYNKAKEVYL